MFRGRRSADGSCNLLEKCVLDVCEIGPSRASIPTGAVGLGVRRDCISASFSRWLACDRSLSQLERRDVNQIAGSAKHDMAARDIVRVRAGNAEVRDGWMLRREKTRCAKRDLFSVRRGSEEGWVYALAAEGMLVAGNRTESGAP
jgi:hypothetical protein